MYLRVGEKLHKVQGHDSSEAQPSGIKDKGLSGLRDAFVLWKKGASTDLLFGQWGEAYSKLASPQFWEYNASKAAWTSGVKGPRVRDRELADSPSTSIPRDSARSPSHPQGGVEVPIVSSKGIQNSHPKATTKSIKVSG